MSQISVEQLIGRLLTDNAFRESVRRDIRRACREGGFSLTDEELRLVMKIDINAFPPLDDLILDGIRRSGQGGVRHKNSRLNS